MLPHRPFSIFMFVILACCVRPVAADEKPPSEVALVEIASVDGLPIYQGEIDQEMAKIVGNKNLAATDRARLLAHFLDQWIDRRLVLKYLERKGETISKQLVDAEIDVLKTRLEQRKTSLKDYLQKRGITEKALRTDLTWRMSWKRYIDRNVTDKVLQSVFDKHPRRYDGTQLRVRHILLPTEDSDGGPSIAKAGDIRREILDGKISFADAVAKYSTGPSKKDDGDLGLITRHGEMVEPFAAVAFELDETEISEPVVTRFGVHLILCVEVKPGDKKWTDVADQLRGVAIQKAFRHIASGQRRKARIEFTGAGPYFDPDSRDLITPAAN